MDIASKVLVIGADSFTGKHIFDLWFGKCDLWGTTFYESKDPKTIQCDILDKVCVKRVLDYVNPDYIINLAGISYIKTADTDIFYKVNVLGVENLLEASCYHSDNIKKIILPSSAAVYGNQQVEFLDESLCPKPINHYGISKLSMEHVASRYFNSLDIILCRPFNYTGLHQAGHFVIPKIVDSYKNAQKQITLGNIHVQREFNNIDYICDIYEKLLVSKAKSTIVNLCSGRTFTLTDIIGIMNKIANYEIEIKTSPELFRTNEVYSLKGSVEKLKSFVSLPEYNDIIDTLSKMFIGEKND